MSRDIRVFFIRVNEKIKPVKGISRLTGRAHHFEGLIVLEGVAEADLVLGKDSEEVLVSLLKSNDFRLQIN